MGPNLTTSWLLVAVFQIMFLHRGSLAFIQRPLDAICRSQGGGAAAARFLSTTTTPSDSSSSTVLSESDAVFLLQAAEHAKLGMGHTFPNPAVGCVLVQDNQVVGKGFHPRAGFPHAEVFALLEAAGHVPDGVQAALGVVQKDAGTVARIETLLDKYAEENGSRELFGNIFADKETTAYVTLEPCCHYGRTPPCASALVVSKASRVVVGFRDPNPRVDGGGVSLCESAGMSVTLASGKPQQACANLVTSFVKRITPDPLREDDYSYVTGGMRRALRARANQLKSTNKMPEIVWGGDSAGEDWEQTISRLELPPVWMEHVDTTLWDHELVLLKLSKVAKKKRAALLMGTRIAEALQAHVAQTLGHTALLYRPGSPPVINLEELLADYKKRGGGDDPKEES